MLILKLCSRQEISSFWFLVSWFLIFRFDLSSTYNKLTNIQIQNYMVLYMLSCYSYCNTHSALYILKTYLVLTLTRECQKGEKLGPWSPWGAWVSGGGGAETTLHSMLVTTYSLPKSEFSPTTLIKTPLQGQADLVFCIYVHMNVTFPVNSLLCSGFGMSL